MSRSLARPREVAALLGAAALSLTSACSTTPGAPADDDRSAVESAAEAMEEEEREDAWGDMNR
jgi:hypothetical protein